MIQTQSLERDHLQAAPFLPADIEDLPQLAQQKDALYAIGQIGRDNVINQLQ
jgi:hypothetical protein